MGDEIFHRALSELRKTGRTMMECRGGSMQPLIPIGSVVTYEVASTYATGDLVLCKVDGRLIHCHQIKDKKEKLYLIGTLKKENGWTKTIYAKVIHIKYPSS